MWENFNFNECFQKVETDQWFIIGNNSHLRYVVSETNGRDGDKNEVKGFEDCPIFPSGIWESK